MAAAPSYPPRTIVVGWEDDSSSRALERAAQLAETFGARLVVVHASSQVGQEHLLEPAKERLDGRGLEVEALERVGDAAEELLRVSDERDADLIVLGSGRGGTLTRLFGTSIGARVGARTARDFLIVRHEPVD